MQRLQLAINWVSNHQRHGSKQANTRSLLLSHLLVSGSIVKQSARQRSDLAARSSLLNWFVQGIMLRLDANITIQWAVWIAHDCDGGAVVKLIL